MGRSKLKDEDKRRIMSARFDPPVARSIEAHAKASGRSIPAEIEARVKATITLDEQGLALLDRLAGELEIICRRNKGLRWHKDLTTWAATAEMMAIGPIQDMKPTNPVDAEVQEAALQPLHDIYQKQDALVWKLAQLGVPVARTRKIGGLLKLNSRDLERAGIDRIPSSDDRAKAVALHEMLSALDDDYDRVFATYQMEMAPYEQAIEEGRALYRDHLMSEAAQASSEGREFNSLHLLGIFPSWR
ncbi:MAG: hypothetical protein ACOVQ0_05785 [Novosphingobium sp.]|uniref:hypothetical protein n=1 Tax=Novosphingobium sp. TaxID=1874826 RepID=UPI003B995460